MHKDPSRLGLQTQITLKRQPTDQNIFSDEAYYFLTIAQTQPEKEVQQDPPMLPRQSATTTITTFDDFVFYEKETRNLFAVGTQWFGEDFSVENVQNFTVDFSSVVVNSPIKVTVGGAAISALSSTMEVKVNNQNAFSISYPAVTSGSLTLGYGLILILLSVQVSSSNLDVSITYNNNGNPGAKAYLDYIEVVGKKQLMQTGNQFSFRSFEAFKSTELEYQIKCTNISQFGMLQIYQPKRISNCQLE